MYRSSPAQGNGTILHLSALYVHVTIWNGFPYCYFFCPRTTGLGWCIPIIGLSSSYQIVGQSWNLTGSVPVVGPVVPLTTWTHVVHSYSATNGVRLWINGTLIGSTGPFMYAPSGARNTITLGTSLSGTSSCAPGNVTKGQFYGMMDELRVYSRELNASEVAVLANPWSFDCSSEKTDFSFSSDVSFDALKKVVLFKIDQTVSQHQ